MRKLGYESSAITRSAECSSGYEKQLNGVLEICYSATPNQLLKFCLQIINKPCKIFDRLIEADRYSAVICHQPFTCFALLLRRRIGGVPIVYVFHSPNHEEYLLSKGPATRIASKLEVFARKAIEGYCLRRSHKIMVLSEYMKHKVTSIHNIRESRIVVNPGAVDIKEFSPGSDREELKQKTGFRKKSVALLTVRNLEKRMGLENLIRAIHLLKTQGLDCHLIVGGTGPEEKKLQALISRRQLGGNISMAGFIPSESLADYYRAADFFILPTVALEGLGLVTPEAMACGTPVLGTPVGGDLRNFIRL